jgi:hypothetical protein
VNTRRGKNRKPLEERSAEKHITREEREGDSLDAVFPLVSCGIERQEGFKPLPCQDLMNALFMLVAGVKCVPGIMGVQVSLRHILLDPKPDSSAAWITGSPQ